jgi:hypothetical protein
MEVYDMQLVDSKPKFEELCNLKQPTIFKFKTAEMLCEMLNLNNFNASYNAFDIQIINIETPEEEYLPLLLKNATILFDKTKNYYTENNQDFLNETSLNKNIQKLDDFLKPPLTCYYEYDVLFGSKQCYTPLSYHIYFRQYILITQDSVTIKITPPKYSKYLHTIYNYETLKMISPVNAWFGDKDENYSQDYEKIKFMEITLNAGDTFFIPPYWWYSILFNSEKSCMVSFKYNTPMNLVATSNYYLLHQLQLQNIKHNVLPTKPADECIPSVHNSIEIETKPDVIEPENAVELQKEINKEE